MDDEQTTQRPNGPPPLGWKGDPAVHADNCRKWIVSGLYYDHPIRVRDMSTNRRAELFDQGAQNLQRAAAGYDTSGNYSTWVDTYWQPRDPEATYLPMPVMNEGLPARQNESARLERPHFRPVITAKGKSPGLKERLGAQTMQQAIRHRLREMQFHKDDSLFHHRMPIHGAAWFESSMVIRYDKTRPVPVLTAVGCKAPGCTFKLASSEVSQQEARKLNLGGNQTELGATADVRVTACPTCPDHPPLDVFQPSLQEAATMKDAVGRPIGKELPLADWEMCSPNDHEMFPSDFGVSDRPGQINDWVRASVRKLDWVALIAPDKVGEVKPENAATLAKYHPVMGAPDVFQGMLSYKVFGDSVRVLTRHKKPWMELVRDDKGQPIRDAKGRTTYRLNKGRSITMAGNVVLLDTTYLFESLTKKGKWIPRTIVEWVPWEFKDAGERARGLSLWETMFDAQIGSNDTWGQTQAVRQRCAVPLYLFLKSHNLEVKPMGLGLPGAALTIDVDPNDTPMPPQLINNTTIDGGVAQERAGYVEFVQRVSHFADIEKGQPPTGVSAAVALDSLKAAASELREPRLGRIKEAKKSCWKHGAEVIQAVYLEGREIRTEDEDGHENWEMVKHTDFASEIEVSVEGEPDVEEQARDIEVTRDLIDKGIIDVAQLTPSQRRKIAKINRAPKELWEDQDLQTDSAQREWLAFKDEGRVPYVDPGLDDHSAHYEDHGRKAMSAHMRDLEERAHWDDALKILATAWDETLFQVMNIPGPPCLQDRIKDTWLQALTMAADLTAQFAPGAPPPPPTLDPATGQPMPAQPPVVSFTIDDEEALHAVLDWRSHMEAHKLADEQKQIQASMRPTLAAPGAEATEAGNQPTDQAPPAEAPQQTVMQQPAGMVQ
jgi:hypothetical protein